MKRFLLLSSALLFAACSMGGSEYKQCVKSGGIVLESDPAVCFTDAEIFFADGFKEGTTQPFFAAIGLIVKYKSESIQIYPYTSVEKMESELPGISTDAGVIDDIVVVWGGQPHIFTAANSLIVYIGNNDQLLRDLTAAFGVQVAGYSISRGDDDQPREALSVDLTEPERDAEISYPFTVSGTSNRDELSVLVIDEAQNVLTETVLTLSDGVFEAELLPAISQTKFGNIILKDKGKAGESFELPVRFPAVPYETVKLYFSNVSQGDAMTDCSQVSSVKRRIPKTQFIGRMSVRYLLQGPTKAERGSGFMTSIPAATALQSIDVYDGIAKVVFSKAFDETVAGSCTVQAIRAQIEQTLLQFSSIAQVRIEVEGKSSDEVLQP